ncbi:MAG: hypothetical protein D3910_24095 [Candidatus Electrothrix sp. ATG2]|nr:hypothetical protein [Candidatus Electrothrix sp. ATG2]
MESFFEWILTNKEWLFSGIGVSVISFLLYFFKNKTVSKYSNEYQNNISISGRDIRQGSVNIQTGSDIGSDIRKAINENSISQTHSGVGDNVGRDKISHDR